MRILDKVLMTALVVGLVGGTALAQTNERPGGPIKGTLIKVGKDPGGDVVPQLVFCGEVEGNAAASYKLNVWRMTPGETAESAIKARTPTVTVDLPKPETIANQVKACSQARQTSEAQSGATLTGTRNRAADSPQTTGRSFITFVIQDFSSCPKSETCDFAWNIETYNGRKLLLATSVQSPFRIKTSATGKISELVGDTPVSTR